MIKTLRLALGTTYSGIKSEQMSKHFLQKITVRFYWIIMVPTKRSLKYSGFLIGGVYGSSVDFQWAEGRHKMWTCQAKRQSRNPAFVEYLPN